MFIGHHAVAFTAKRIGPAISLGTLLTAVQFMDLLWPVFLLADIEHFQIVPGYTVVSPLNLYDYPISHSLAGALIWSALFGGVYFWVRRHARNAVILAVAVFSHWILDFITHGPDMPLLFSGSAHVGLGLWNSLAGTLAVEIGLFAGGVIVYTRSTVAKDRIGTYGWWGFVTFLFTMYIASIFGPPPPNVGVVAVGGNTGWLLVLWAYWVDRHRTRRIP